MSDDWRDHAACKGADPNLFFPGRGDWMAIRVAKQICAGCDVRAECLEEAIINNEREGIFGGTTVLQRRKIRRLRTDLPRSPRAFRPRPPCGTIGGYRAHLRRGEETCPACRDAIRQDSALRETGDKTA